MSSVARVYLQEPLFFKYVISKAAFLLPVGPGAQDRAGLPQQAGVRPYDSLNTLSLLTVLLWNKYLLGDLRCMTVAGYVYGGHGGRG